MTDTSTVTVKPCPFCGSAAHMFREPDPDVDHGYYYSYKCNKCRAQSGERYAVETCGIFFAGLRDDWNTRVPQTPAQAALSLRNIEPDDGFWRSCSGCHETVDGQETGWYPYSPVFKCHLGAGCRECGGLGAVWDDTDYEDMARAIAGGE